MTDSNLDALPDIEPPVGRAALSLEVKAQRDQAVKDYGRLDSEWQPRIDAHVEALQCAVDSQILTHRAIADRTDIGLAVDTRWSAMWELSGRTLSICQVVLHDLRGGFTSQATGNVRCLFEAAQLLSALSFHLEDGDLRRWLAGEWIREKTARAVMQRKEAAAHQRMVELGEVPEGDVMKSGHAIYDDLSRAAHHRRGGFPDALSVGLRQFSYGRHPNAEVRARNVLVIGHLVEIAVMSVADALADLLHDRAYFNENWSTLSSSLDNVRRAHPLP